MMSLSTASEGMKKKMDLKIISLQSFSNTIISIYRQGYQMFGIKLSFVATRSGLLRWVDHIAHDPTSPDP